VKLERIVVGVDGSANSRTALSWAAGMATATGAEVVAVHAVGLLEHLARPGSGSEAAADDLRARFEDEWCEPLAGAGVPARRALRDGSPVAVLLAVADEEGADLIVVGSRGVGGFPELLLGRTSTQVAQHARCPVLIVPDPRDAPGPAAGGGD
jgi:nucleotide-binding universal stress UspA family protein